MSDNTKLLQSISDRISSLDVKVDKGFTELKEEVLENRKRIDKFGLELAELADDAPTIEEFEDLEKRVIKIENRAVKN